MADAKDEAAAAWRAWLRTATPPELLDQLISSAGVHDADQTDELRTELVDRFRARTWLDIASFEREEAGPPANVDVYEREVAFRDDDPDTEPPIIDREDEWEQASDG